MPLARTARRIVKRLQEAGHSAFWVGGCVRDRLLGKKPKDYDIATSAKPPEIEALFARTLPVGRQFGVVIAVEDGEQFQIATYREESDYTDGRRPGTVTFSDARADATRRDFTINGLFYDPIRRKVFDWVGGETDLKAKRIRTIGHPQERFDEDHLRLLRAVRFAAQLDFTIDPPTFAAIRSNAVSIRRISPERVREELMRLFRPPHAARGLALLHDSGLLPYVLPEIATTIGCDQSPDYHPEGDVFTHICKVLAHLPADAHPSLPWAALLHDVAKPVTASRDEATGAIHFYGHERVGADMTVDILKRLRFPRRQIDEIATCVRHHMQFKDVTKMRKSTVRRILLRPTFPIELALHRVDCLGSNGKLDHYQFMQEAAAELDRKPDIRPPLVNGRDLIALGCMSGPAMGRLLGEIREKQLQEELKTRRGALAWAKRRLKEAK